MDDRVFVQRAIGASILIGLGVWCLLRVGGIVGAVLFSLGLLGVCYLQLNLFTGKCGYVFVKHDWRKMAEMLIINMLFGYLWGAIIGLSDAAAYEAAVVKVMSWDFSFGFFLKSVACGMIMFIAVDLHKQGTSLGILVGIPMFIMAGFQHSIANIITLGVARAWSWTLPMCILGNWIGSILIWIVKGNLPVFKKKDPRYTKFNENWPHFIDL